MAGPLLVTMDGKRHNEMRRHVLPAFTKAALESWQAMIDELAAKLVGVVLDNPGCDIVLSSSGTRLMNEFRLVLYTETGRGGVEVFPVPVRLADPLGASWRSLRGRPCGVAYAPCSLARSWRMAWVRTIVPA